MSPFASLHREEQIVIGLYSINYGVKGAYVWNTDNAEKVG